MTDTESAFPGYDPTALVTGIAPQGQVVDHLTGWTVDGSAQFYFAYLQQVGGTGKYSQFTYSDSAGLDVATTILLMYTPHLTNGVQDGFDSVYVVTFAGSTNSRARISVRGATFTVSITNWSGATVYAVRTGTLDPSLSTERYA